jgi:adenosylcobyric acid synthase
VRGRMPNKSLQICGTGSGVGKSVIVAGLCRIFLQDGYKTAPFKAQNMALNSFVTKEMGEIGRAQAVQAQACRIAPTVDMNPVLLKPVSDMGAQVIVLGKSIGNMKALQYTAYKSKLVKTVRQSYKNLAKEYDIVVLEGAGSPAEINLKKHDIVNMKMAEYADASVILVGDIDKGGVFAWLIGTLELLTEKEKKRVKGIIINKFRGDKRLLMPGIRFLEKYTGIKVLGIIPYFTGKEDINIPEEDSFSFEQKREKIKSKKKHKFVKISVIYLPHISNFTDFDNLEREKDVILRYVRKPEELDNPDVIIIPGTKNTISDLKWLNISGFREKIISFMDQSCSGAVVGICGGYQMLGTYIYDTHSIESKAGRIKGLGILPVETYLEKEKTLTQVKAKEISSGMEVTGYEIHNGRSKAAGNLKPAFRIIEKNRRKSGSPDGAVSKDGRVIGTYIHGVFDSPLFRRNFLNKIRKNKGWNLLSPDNGIDIDKEFDKLARHIRGNIDMPLLYKILNKA